MERTKEELKEAMKEIIVKAIQDIDPNGDDRRTLYTIHDKVGKDIMLTRDEAKLLEAYLEEDKDMKILDITDMGRVLALLTIMELDALGIYPDLWNIYCRPGTYSIH